jgi:Ca-activated chloride channel family protein
MRGTVLGVTALLACVAASVSRPAARATGPEVVVTGRVTDAASRAPLQGAQVMLERTSHGTTTGADGRYRLTVPRDAGLGRTAMLAVSLLGYEPVRVRIRTTEDRVERDVALRQRAVALQGLVATAVAARGAAEDRAVFMSTAEMAPVPPRGFQALAPGAPPAWNTEAYDPIEESGFVAAASVPLSTFSIDVDRASYGNVRRFILDGETPPQDAVRIEEMVNYFPYSYPQPQAGEPFTITTEVAAAPWRPRNRLVRIGLQSRRIETASLPPSNLVFLIDVSGSMQSPDKLPLVKQSLRLLVDQLRPVDRVAIVVYAGAAGLVLPSTPGSEKTRILSAIEALEAGGSTAGGEGLRLAYDVARRHHLDGGNNRVILATDGDFNVGPSSDAEMVRLVEEERGGGTYLTVLGYGTGNLKDAKMEKLADHGNGNYAYVDGLMEARKVLVHEMGATLLTLAKDVKLQVEFNPARVQAYRLIGYEDRRLRDEEFDDDAKDAGDLGAGHSVTALYEVVPVGVEPDVEIHGVDSLRYRRPARASERAGDGELAYVKVRYKEPGQERSRLVEHPIPDRVGAPSRDLRFAAAVAGFGMLLRESPYRGGLTLQTVEELARQGRGADPEGYRADFLALLDRYAAISGGGEAETTLR